MPAIRKWIVPKKKKLSELFLYGQMLAPISLDIEGRYKVIVFQLSKVFIMNIQIITLFLATMTTGLMAGIFFTWTNAVTPGIGKLNDLEYLSALQSMNRVILNPAFYIVFISPVFMLPLATILNYNSASFLVVTLLLIATVIYLLGVFFITVVGNIPLNNLLEKTGLEGCSLEEAINLRNKIETKWNNFNLIRTITSSIAFMLMIIICFSITI